MIIVSRVFSRNKRFRSLNLRQNMIGDSGATSLSQSLAVNSSLTSLNLSGNRFGDSGAASLFQAIATNSSLSLDLSRQLLN